MSPDAEHFDRWYADMAVSAARAAIQQGELDLPPEVESSSLLPASGIEDVLALLQLSRDDVLVDLACGRGGYGLEMARRRGAALIGVDFSAVAIERARVLAAAGFSGVRATFEVGRLEAGSTSPRLP